MACIAKRRTRARLGGCELSTPLPSCEKESPDSSGLFYLWLPSGLPPVVHLTLEKLFWPTLERRSIIGAVTGLAIPLGAFTPATEPPRAVPTFGFGILGIAMTTYYRRCNQAYGSHQAPRQRPQLASYPNESSRLTGNSRSSHPTLSAPTLSASLLLRCSRRTRPRFALSTASSGTNSESSIRSNRRLLGRVNHLLHQSALPF